MPTRIVLAVSLVVAGCSAGPRTSPATPPGAASPETAAEAEGPPVQSVEVREVSGGGIAAYCAGRPDEVARDSFVVSPMEVDLNVGDALPLSALRTTSARTGDHVPAYYDARPADLVRIAGRGEIRALAPGTAYLEVRPLCPDTADPAAVSVRVVRLTITE